MMSLSALPASGSTALPAALSGAFPFSRTAGALAAWQHNASEAARWAHPSWWAPALDMPPATVSACFDALREALASTHAGALAACSRALLRAADVALPGFDSLRAPNPAVLDALPVEVGLRALRMRALLLRRAEVRRLIDKQNRRRLAQWVGVPLERLGAVPRQGAAHAALGNVSASVPVNVSANAPANAPDLARLVARGDLPPLEEIDDERLAYEGYALIVRDMQETAWSARPAAAAREQAREGPHEAHRREHPHEASHPRRHPPPEPRPCPLLRLALPRDLPPPWPRASARELDVGGTALLFAQLPELLPEWAWLFG
ncbi:type III secretion protein HrpB4 [Burkholderia sp. WSM2230]|uniref:type III secretion protein HrpB4 n=1 Tax=Burkholderia sp. WSM2230 TaxID=944435 RepID=UPI00041775EA|nr:type III secretion protein HrpB4 [Burkholderia sp. WSM2230]